MAKYALSMMSHSVPVESPLTLIPVRDGPATPPQRPELTQPAQIEEQRALPANDPPTWVGGAAAAIPSWDVFKVVLTIIGVMAVGAAAVSIAVLWPGLTLLGFCVALCLMTFTGMPLIMASMADRSEQLRSRPVDTPGKEDLLIQPVSVTSRGAPGSANATRTRQRWVNPARSPNS